VENDHQPSVRAGLHTQTHYGVCESVLGLLPTVTDVGQKELLRKQLTNCNILPPAERKETHWRSQHKPDPYWLALPLHGSSRGGLPPPKLFHINLFTIQLDYGYMKSNLSVELCLTGIST